MYEMLLQKGLIPIVKPAAAAARWGKGIQEKVVEK
jgi:hypothetical protein